MHEARRTTTTDENRKQYVTWFYPGYNKPGGNKLKIRQFLF